MSWTPQQCMYDLPIQINDIQYYHHEQSVQLESGVILPQVTIGYHSYGTLSKTRDNVIWVCHALTANSAVDQWWGDLIGPGKTLDTDKYFVVCANMLGSCYGTTGPRTMNPNYGNSYGLEFPAFTIRDMVKVNLLLMHHLNIDEIALAIGGSCGGHQAMEMAYKIPDQVKRLALLVCGAKESAWAIALHEAGRMAITTDSSFRENRNRAGNNGLKTARAVGLLGYRTIDAYLDTQADTDNTKVQDFKSASYVRYQGDKLERRFYAQSYYFLLNALDTHNMGRGRESVEWALQQLTMPTTVIGINSDMLIPISEQVFLAKHIPNARFRPIDSAYGHDGFLLETEQIDRIIQDTMDL